LVDFMPALYLIGIVAVFSTTQNQRLGDLAAGTVIVVEPKADDTLPVHRPSFTEVPEGWDVSAVTDEDVAIMRQFLNRRQALKPEARGKLGFQIAKGIEQKISHPAQSMNSEQTIETVLKIKEMRG
jgi:hypothetical protein